MSSVDEILATGHYTDRRGREWKNITHWNVESWAAEPYGKPDILPDEMRLLIERDMHRDVCPGFRDCAFGIHPVPIVYHAELLGWWMVNTRRLDAGTLAEAMDAARALAVGA